jgi:dienelactone hydrolase
MKKVIYSAIALCIVAASCNSNEKQTSEIKIEKDSLAASPGNLKSENVDYQGDGITMKGLVAYNDSSKEKRPVVLIVPEWWGISDYTRNRARQLAELGYLAFAIDVYGDGKNVETPDEAGKLAAPFYTNMQMGKSRFEAALAKIKTYPNADTNRIAAIGYCFGGAMVLNMARLGEPLKSVVSFHGNLIGAPADKSLLKSAVLVCHGEADQFVKPEEVALFKKQMDSINAPYTFKSYPGATHAFTNPEATAKGEKYKIPIAYNAAADSASFNEMKMFFDKTLK